MLNRLDDKALDKILSRAESDLGRPLPVDDDAKVALRAMADGDGRYLLNMAEALADYPLIRCSMGPVWRPRSSRECRFTTRVRKATTI